MDRRHRDDDAGVLTMMLDDWCFVPVSQESQGFPFSRESNRGDKKALCIALHLMSRFSGLQSPLPYMQRLDRLEKITAQHSRAQRNQNQNHSGNAKFGAGAFLQ